MKTHPRCAFLAILFMFASPLAWAQTNIFPASGNVGIGTVNPEVKLVVQQSSGTLQARLKNTAASGRAIFEVKGNSAYFDMRAYGTTYSETLFGLAAADTSIIMGREGKLLIGTYENEDFILGTNNIERIRITNSGNVGIGTVTPRGSLDVNGGIFATGAIYAAALQVDNGSYVSRLYPNSVEFHRAGANYLYCTDPAGYLMFVAGNRPGPDFVINSSGNVGIGMEWDDCLSKLDVNGMITVRGSNILNLSNAGGAATITEGSGTELRGDTNHPIQILNGALLVNYDATGAAYGTSGLFVNGNVGIGTTSPTEKLAVNGRIRAKEVIVETGWSDYVFDSDYRLAPLSEIEQQIKAEKHLPGIPSAQEVAQGGVSLGDMQARLLQKVEELTLYTIQLQKENEALKARVTALEAK
jgi:hypothetical protein